MMYVCAMQECGAVVIRKLIAVRSLARAISIVTFVFQLIAVASLNCNKIIMAVNVSSSDVVFKWILEILVR